MDENLAIFQMLEHLERTAVTEVEEADDGIIFRNNLGEVIGKIFIAGTPAD